MRKLTLILLFFPLAIYSQKEDSESIEKKWEAIIKDNSIDEKISRNKELCDLIGNRHLRSPNTNLPSFTKGTYDLNKLEGFNEKWSSDSSLILTSWLFPLDDEHHQYNLQIQTIASIKGQRNTKTAYKLHSFCHNYINIDCGEETSNLESCISEDIVFHKEGFFYYDLIETKSRFDNYYTIIGWSKEGLTSQKKIITSFKIKVIDTTICLIPANIIQQLDGSYANQQIFEYSAQTTMKLNYSESQNWILMDHLSPPTSQYEGVYEFYGPDLSFDAYVWENDRWTYYADVDADKGLDKKKMEFENPDKVLKEEKLYTPK